MTELPRISRTSLLLASLKLGFIGFGGEWRCCP